MCDNEEIIETNIRNVKISSPDVCSRLYLQTFIELIDHLQYRGWDPDKAVKDYYNRIRDHEKHYEPVEETIWPFIRIINVALMFKLSLTFLAEFIIF